VATALPSDLTQFHVPKRVLQHRWTAGPHPLEQVLVKWSQMPLELSTWEPLLHLRQQFPRVPAWGHASSQEGGNVSAAVDAAPTADVTDGSLEEEDDVGAPTTSDTGPRPKRQARPNKQYAGPEWDV
jgi:hypothetical protein